MASSMPTAEEVKSLTNAQLCAKWSLEERPVEVKGRGVFPGARIPAGELVIKFEGPIYDKDTCPEFSEAIQVRGAAGGRDFEMELVGADREAGSVALVDQQIRERRGDAAGVFDLCFLAGAVEIHRAGSVDHKVGTEIGIGLEFLDVKSVRAGEGLPIEAAGVIARDVFPILRELDGGTAVRRAVLARDVAHHRHARLDGKRAEAGEEIAVDEGVHALESRGQLPEPRI
jgi:hypothetical protein